MKTKFIISLISRAIVLNLIFNLLYANFFLIKYQSSDNSYNPYYKSFLSGNQMVRLDFNMLVLRFNFSRLNSRVCIGSIVKSPSAPNDYYILTAKSCLISGKNEVTVANIVVNGNNKSIIANIDSLEFMRVSDFNILELGKDSIKNFKLSKKNVTDIAGSANSYYLDFIDSGVSDWIYLSISDKNGKVYPTAKSGSGYIDVLDPSSFTDDELFNGKEVDDIYTPEFVNYKGKEYVSLFGLSKRNFSINPRSFYYDEVELDGKTYKFDNFIRRDKGAPLLRCEKNNDGSKFCSLFGVNVGSIVLTENRKKSKPSVIFARKNN